MIVELVVAESIAIQSLVLSPDLGSHPGRRIIRTVNGHQHLGARRVRQFTHCFKIKATQIPILAIDLVGPCE